MSLRLGKWFDESHHWNAFRIPRELAPVWQRCQEARRRSCFLALWKATLEQSPLYISALYIYILYIRKRIVSDSSSLVRSSFRHRCLRRTFAKISKTKKKVTGDPRNCRQDLFIPLIASNETRTYFRDIPSFYANLEGGVKLPPRAL